MTAREMRDELRLIYAERRDTIQRLKTAEEAVKRSRRLPILAEIGALFSEFPTEIDALIARRGKAP